MKIWNSALVVACVWSSIALACYEAPKDQFVPVDVLIQRSSRIVLATAVRADLQSDGGVRYRFRTVERLAGKVDATFELDGSGATEGEATDFKHHRGSAFWKDTSGRTWHHNSCSISPSFNVGSTYLIFLDRPYHRKSFELIIRTHGNKETIDLWLQYVRSNLVAK